jgi:hypothetical protein
LYEIDGYENLQATLKKLEIMFQEVPKWTVSTIPKIINELFKTIEKQAIKTNKNTIANRNLK